ncbi:MAG: potassium channel family protein [Neisseria sp.]|nr:potassium channel family protein [Neisseria sp.]
MPLPRFQIHFLQALRRLVRSVLGDLLFYGLGAFTVALICGAAAFYHHIEKWSWLDSFYFAVITLSTVGYGDFAPHTPAGKLFTIGFILVGLGLFVTVTANLGSHIYHTMRKHTHLPGQHNDNDNH